ncbi:putative flavin-containing monooxygenase 1 [Sesamum angolense]|uniref:Flavin-containing monooxygenase n=1 Tax=Sesamum angolense TaxID=2727404 RepID=A0AAE1T6N0_9LAMI|nr:putative flavin-containing monooxygenase 1 [Sesamum angolense]
METRVAIIGAGISGLLACKYAASRGFNPVVFEAQEQVGGLWNHTIESTRLQNVKEFFQFSDFPWPSSVQDALPTNSQLLEYLQSYARHFGLFPYIKFNSKVVSVSYVGECEEEMQSWELWGGGGKAFGSKGKWKLKVLHTKEESVEEDSAACRKSRRSLQDTAPKFSQEKCCTPWTTLLWTMPALPSSSKEKESVIGSGKSAIDIAFECAKANGNNIPCTVIQRTIHWMLPHDAQPWGLSFGFLCFSRFAELLVHKPGEGFLSSVLATSLSPLMETSLKKYNMIPKESVLQETSSCQILFLPPNFYDKVEDGSIVLKKSHRLSFCKEGLILDGEDDPVKADIVIFATGYKGDEKLKNIFSSPTIQNCIAGSPTSAIPLYRQMIHPRIPQLAVISYSESLSNLYTFEMRCKWLGCFLDGAFKLPSIKEMEEDIKKWEKYMKRYSGNVPIVATENQSYDLHDPNDLQVVVDRSMAQQQAAGTSRSQVHENDDENYDEYEDEDSSRDDETDDDEYEAT